ncbi:MAG: helix-turn-helix domain-containing protein [Treponema sp.]|jgi:transcriptional regulator with XRE-family HTH domain|nr:helix-turn-helix domain-containing protein [Treponema sp.]
MALSDRISTILKENGFNQKQFAESVFVTEGYVSRLLKDAIGMSNSTAMLIEKVHGYSKEWILHGTGPKMLKNGGAKSLTAVQKKLIAEIELMTDDELFFIVTYIEAVKKKKAMSKQ